MFMDSELIRPALVYGDCMYYCQIGYERKKKNHIERGRALLSNSRLLIMFDYLVHSWSNSARARPGCMAVILKHHYPSHQSSPSWQFVLQSPKRMLQDTRCVRLARHVFFQHGCVTNPPSYPPVDRLINLALEELAFGGQAVKWLTRATRTSPERLVDVWGVSFPVSYIAWRGIDPK